LKLDPNNVDALVGAALTEVNDYRFYSGMDEKPGQITKIEDLLAKAIRIDPTNARAYIVRGMIYRVTKRSKAGVEAAQNAVRLNPNYAAAYAQLAQNEVTPAELPLAIANIDQAIKLSPRDPEMGRWLWIKARTFNYMGRYQDAVREIQAALDNGYSAWSVYLQLAVAYASMGQKSEAEVVLAQARKLNPKLTIKWYRARIDFPEVFYEGLRKAGLPEE
jgi:tetratricopeptide (TPR) repeat protein